MKVDVRPVAKRIGDESFGLSESPRKDNLWKLTPHAYKILPRYMYQYIYLHTGKGKTSNELGREL